ncbi:hypothetical protein HY991_01305 [Candidatus Micrarchaeota archaeon]|nr:hypothetical protein [Candidatus Micrarchaeota archaeon]
MSKIILVTKTHANEVSATLFGRRLVRELQSRGHKVQVRQLPREYGLFYRLLNAPPEKLLRMEGQSEEEKGWVSRLHKENPGALIIALHNCGFKPKEGGKPNKFSFTLKDHDQLKFPNDYIVSDPYAIKYPPSFRPQYAIEIPVIYKDPSRGTLLARKQQEIREAFGGISNERAQKLLGRLRPADLKASKQAGLMGELMLKTLAECIVQQILPIWMDEREEKK